MKLASYLYPKETVRESYGAVIGDAIVDLSSDVAPSLRVALATEGVDGLTRRFAERQGSTTLPLDSVKLLPPLTGHGRIFCVGLNYRSHAREAGKGGKDDPVQPSVFVRFPSSFVGHEDAVIRPRESQQFDYEAELAVVIGRRGRRVPHADAMDYVAGYACMAENSVRDWQRHATQVTPGKNFDASGSFGPWLMTADEADAPEKMVVVGRLNGETVQQDCVGNMIFPVARLICYLSTFTELCPGDVIATGTPAGVGAGRKPPKFMRSGDVFEVDISSLGVLRNVVQADN